VEPVPVMLGGRGKLIEIGIKGGRVLCGGAPRGRWEGFPSLKSQRPGSAQLVTAAILRKERKKNRSKERNREWYLRSGGCRQRKGEEEAKNQMNVLGRDVASKRENLPSKKKKERGSVTYG